MSEKSDWVCVINFTLIYFSFILFGSGVVWRSQPCDRAETCPGFTGRMDGCIINELHETQWYKTMCDFLKISANFNLDDSRRTCHTCAEPCKTSHAKDFLKKVPAPPKSKSLIKCEPIPDASLICGSDKIKLKECFESLTLGFSFKMFMMKMIIKLETDIDRYCPVPANILSFQENTNDKTPPNKQEVQTSCGLYCTN